MKNRQVRPRPRFRHQLRPGPRRRRRQRGRGRHGHLRLPERRGRHPPRPEGRQPRPPEPGRLDRRASRRPCPRPWPRPRRRSRASTRPTSSASASTRPARRRSPSTGPASRSPSTRSSRRTSTPRPGSGRTTPAHAEAAEITALAAAEHPEYLAKCGGTYSSEWFWSKILHCLRTDPKVASRRPLLGRVRRLRSPAVLTGIADPRTDEAQPSAPPATRPCSTTAGAGYPAEAFLAQLDPRLGELRDRLYDQDLHRRRPGRRPDDGVGQAARPAGRASPSPSAPSTPTSAASARGVAPGTLRQDHRHQHLRHLRLARRRRSCPTSRASAASSTARSCPATSASRPASRPSATSSTGSSTTSSPAGRRRARTPR
ncbi:MAG: hypothetical protein M0C28_12870 [Candidatus Moduliflexus flocculans]|nr:hypothetical protein [Candidatus Moduliflexus flocculans]